MEFITDNLGQSLIALGLILLTIEVVVLGLSTFILFFLGVSIIISGVAVISGLIEPDFMILFVFNGVLTALLTYFLWKPMKQFQNKTEVTRVESDLIGNRFVLEEDVSKSTPIKQRYSGLEWTVKSKQPISKGCEIKISKVEVGVIHVEPIDE